MNPYVSYENMKALEEDNENLRAHNAKLRAALKGLLGIIEDPETRTIPQVVDAIKATGEVE